MKRLITLLACLFVSTAALAQTSTVPISGGPQAVTPLTGDEIVPLVQNGITRRATVGQVLAGIPVTHVATQAALTTFFPAGGSLTAGYRVTRDGYYAAGDKGELAYVYTTNACTLNAGAGDGGSQVPASGGIGCWLGSFPSDPTTAQFGAKCDYNGSAGTDDTTAIQNTWNYAASAGRSTKIVGTTGSNCYISTITAPAPTTGQSGNRSPLVGGGSGVTTFTSNVTGANCAITIAVSSGNYGVNSDYNATFKGFSLISKNTPATNGQGICLSYISHIDFDDILIQAFTNGVSATDTINATWYKPHFIGNGYHVKTFFVSKTHPNNWTFYNATATFAVNDGFAFVQPTQLRFVGGDYENNGTGGSAGSTYAVIHVIGNGVDGTQGLDLQGGYFSANNGAADVLIDNNSLSNTSGVHTIRGTEFQRNVSLLQYTTSNVYLVNNGTGTSNTAVNIVGSGFQDYSTYVSNSNRPYITVTTPLATNYSLSTAGNFFGLGTLGDGAPIPTGDVGAWLSETGPSTYTATLTCGAGTLTSATSTGYYKRLPGRKIVMHDEIVNTTNGTCASLYNVALPIATAATLNQGGSGSTGVNTALVVRALPASSTVAILKYDASYPGGTGTSAYIEFTYGY